MTKQSTDSKKLLSREPSFMYDTTVEAFNTQGTAVDEMKIETHESVKGLSDEDVQLFVEDIEQLDGFDVQKFECNDTDLSQQEGSSLRLVAAESDNLLSLSSSTATVKTVTTSAVSIPGSEKNRRLSAISLEENSKISTTPEGEKYFMKREESFVAKVAKGEVEKLAVDINDYFSLEHSASSSSLSVRPVVVSPEAEIVVEDLGSQSNLTVKPLDKPCSSYEHLYDTIDPEIQITNEAVMTKSEIMENLGDKFVGTQEMPEYFTSFEELYLRADEQSNPEISDSMTDQAVERWSAPAGTVEPPILNASELSNRLQPVQAKIDSHWDEFEILMSTETITGGG